MRVATRFKYEKTWVILYDHSSESNEDDFQLIMTTNENDPLKGGSLRGKLEGILNSDFSSSFHCTSFDDIQNKEVKKIIRDKVNLYKAAHKSSCFTMTPGYWIQLSPEQLDEALLEVRNSAHLRQIIRELTWALIEGERSIGYYKDRLDVLENTLKEIEIKASLGIDIHYDRR